MSTFPRVRLWFALFACAMAQACTNPSLQTGRTNQPPSQPRPESLLECAQLEVDFGKVPPLAQRKAVFRLINRGNQPVEVTRINTSCECLRIQLQQTTIQPSETVTATCMLDLRADPGAKGAIGIEVEGLTPSGVRAFAITVNVSVAPSGNGDF